MYNITIITIWLNLQTSTIIVILVQQQLQYAKTSMGYIVKFVYNIINV